MQFSDKIIKLAAEAERELRPQFDEFDRIAYVNTARVLEAFSAHRVS